MELKQHEKYKINRRFYKKNMTTAIISVYNVTLNYVIKYHCYAKYQQYQNK